MPNSIKGSNKRTRLQQFMVMNHILLRDFFLIRFERFGAHRRGRDHMKDIEHHNKDIQNALTSRFAPKPDQKCVNYRDISREKGCGQNHTHFRKINFLAMIS